MDIQITVNLNTATVEEATAKILLAAQRFGWTEKINQEQITIDENGNEVKQIIQVDNPETYLACFSRCIAQYGIDNAKAQAIDNAKLYIENTKAIELQTIRSMIDSEYNNVNII